MGMEQRSNNSYYYRKRWQNGTCQSEYVGRGEFAQVLAELDALERLPARQEAVAFRKLRSQIKQQATLVLSTEAELRALVKAVLIACGFHQHKRQWRKRMHEDTTIAPQPAAAVVTVDTHAEQRREGLRALNAALDIAPQPAKKGGKIAERDRAIAERDKRAAVRKVLADYPCIWGHLRQMLSSGQRAIIEASCGGSLDSATGQLLDKSLTAMRRSLGYDDAPPLEKLLIEQVVFAWADLEYVQMHYAKSAFGSHTHASGQYWDRRVNGAQARYTRATEALARVRRLAMPQPLRVNIGGQQINVAGNS